MTELEFKQETVRPGPGRSISLLGRRDLGTFGSDAAQLAEGRGDCVRQNFPY
jgi:hypothetical protein